MKLNYMETWNNDMVPWCSGFHYCASSFNKASIACGTAQKMKFSIKGTVMRAELNDCDVHLVSRILWHERITLSLKEWKIMTFNTYRKLSTIISPYKCRQRYSSEDYLFSSKKNLWRRMLEANKKQVSLKIYSLKIRIDSVNQFLRNKEKVKPVT